jgi:aminobenzoyl-glutamate utilization protein B
MKQLLPFLLLSGLLTAADHPEIRDDVDSKAQHFGDVSRKIWEFAEVGYKETKSSALLASELKAAGFTVETGVAGMPTAFVASFGKGKPVIGILGEFDALPGLSQEDTPERKPRIDGGPGHGCGHNLFGAGSALAAIALKDWLVARKISGTIRFFGTPAEEGGGGKVYMARAGLFTDVDAVIAWHPGDANRVTAGSSLGNINAKFRFYGRPSHASAAPEQGRSALDGLMIMSMAVEMLREHVPSTTRIHYIFTKAGSAPNVVPDFAEGYFYARQPDMPTLDGVWERIVKCAQAGALASETRMEMEIIASVYNLLPNTPLIQALDQNLHIVGGVRYTPEETAFAETLRKSFLKPDAAPLSKALDVSGTEPASGVGGSTDVADVSWNVPVGQINTATFVPGTPGHSWQSAACAGSSIGRKGMIVAAKTLALTGADLFLDPKLIEAARKDFDARRAGHEYRSRIPASQGPPLHYRDYAAGGGEQ